MTTKRDALEANYRDHCFTEVGEADWQELLDAWGDARELAGHVGACKKTRSAGINYRGEQLGIERCGTSGWYCPDAPKGGQDDS